MSERTLLNSAQVALRLGHKASWFLRKRADLEAKGFPPPMDGCGMRWDPVAIDDYFDARRRREAVDPLVGAEQELIRRAQAAAASHAP